MEANSSHPSFYKVVPAKSLREGSLRLPKVFAGHHGNGFPKYACLEVPTGAIWKVELRKSEGHVWLDKGWREFAEFYSIEEGHLLVFKNEGGRGSLFHVLIFNTTGLEIKYHAANSAFTTPKVTEFKEEGEDIDAGSDDDYARPRNSHKNRSIVPSVNRSGKRQVGESGSKKIVPLSASLKQKLNCARYKRMALEKAGILKSEKPHFILYVTPTCVAPRYTSRIPAAHFKRYHKKDYNHHGENDIVLHGSKGRSWRMQFTGRDRNPNDATFSCGWREFVEENELDEGDVCMFEMMNAKVKEYKVTTYSLGDYP